MYWLFKLLTGKEGMGHGDFKLLAALGAWCGVGGMLPIMLLSSLVGAIIGSIWLACAGRDRATPIPFGPYLAIAGWMQFILGAGRSLQAYLRWSGLTLRADARDASSIARDRRHASGKIRGHARASQALGIAVVDADRGRARGGRTRRSRRWREIVARFGPGVLQADGRLDRAALRERVFADAAPQGGAGSHPAPAHPRLAARACEPAAGPYAVAADPAAGRRRRPRRLSVAATGSWWWTCPRRCRSRA